VAAQRFYLEENGLLWLSADLEKTQVNKTARSKEKEEDRKAEMRGQMGIPRTMQRRIIHEAHDTPAVRHFGADGTYVGKKEQHFWKQMSYYTQRYVAGGDLYHRTNHCSGKPMGLLQSLPIAKGYWQRIGIDFITDLLISENSHHCIVMFVDHMTKGAHWRACKETIDAQAFGHIFTDNIVHLQGVPAEIASDRNVCFTADYWRDVATILLTTLLMSTVFHPETDSLSDNSNKTVVHYLCGFAIHDQANWDDYLPLAEYANNSFRTPFNEADTC
jgi:hypothetical protein